MALLVSCIVLGACREDRARLRITASDERVRVLRGKAVDVIRYAPDEDHAELSAILAYLAVPPAPSETSKPGSAANRSRKASTAGGAKRAATSAPPNSYRTHVETTCGGVVLTGLLGDKAARDMQLEDVYVPLLAPRTDLLATERQKGSRGDPTGEAPRALQQLVEQVEEGRRGAK